MPTEESNETLKNDIKNKILEELKDRLIRDFKEQTKEMRKHISKIKGENDYLRNRECDQQ